LAEAGVASGIQKLTLAEAELKAAASSSNGGLAGEFEQAKADLDSALRSSFDTPGALQVILRLVRNANVSMSEPNADLATIEAVARWVTKIVGVFGLDPNAQPPYESSLGWGPANPTAKAAGGGVVDPKVAVQPYSGVFAKVKGDVAALGLTTDVALNTLLAELRPDAEFVVLEKEASSDQFDIERLALPFLRAVSGLRDELRRAAINPDNKDKKGAILALSDRIRDYDLVELGVQLDDQPDRPSLIKFVPVAKLVAAREEKAAAVAEKARLKEEAARAREKAEEEKWAKAKVPPQDLFRGNTADFSAFDAEGLPTKLADGSDVPKTQHKRLKKEWDRQKKLHDSYLEKFGPA
jgi:cysteinyl-tRNA synthetase